MTMDKNGFGTPKKKIYKKKEKADLKEGKWHITQHLPLMVNFASLYFYFSISFNIFH
jgi:hypothetical protein